MVNLGIYRLSAAVGNVGAGQQAEKEHRRHDGRPAHCELPIASGWSISRPDLGPPLSPGRAIGSISRMRSTSGTCIAVAASLNSVDLQQSEPVFLDHPGVLVSQS